VDLHHLLLAGLPAHSCEKAPARRQMIVASGVWGFSTRTDAIGVCEPL
jgi:hypothetical protein